MDILVKNGTGGISVVYLRAEGGNNIKGEVATNEEQKQAIIAKYGKDLPITEVSLDNENKKFMK